MATLRKVDKAASSRLQLVQSAEAKLQEFARLGYPKGIRRFMCAIMARDTSNTAWRYVRSQQVEESSSLGYENTLRSKGR